MTAPLRARAPGLDLLRAAAVLAMMAAHTTRLLPFDLRREWSRLALQFEPWIPTLFLILVGASLSFSRAAAAGRGEPPGSWLLRQGRRAAGLWLLSALFFLLEEGPRFPDVLLASGILCSIAYAIVAAGALLLFPRPAPMLGAALLAGSAVYARLDLSGSKTFLLMGGNSPLFPLLLFAVAGALWAEVRRSHPRASAWAALPALLAAAWLIHRHGLEALFSKPLGRSDASRILAPPLFVDGDARNVPYYSLRPVLALLCLCLHIAALEGSRLLRLAEARARWMLALGRRALEAYVLHLFLLAILVVAFGVRPLRAAWQGDALLLAVASGCWAWAVWREGRKAPYLRGTQSVSVSTSEGGEKTPLRPPS